MPYLSFDLDALEVAPEVANFAGMDDGGDHVVHGLLKLWRHAWRQKSDVVTRSRLRGFFHRADPERIEGALAEFGFIAPSNDETFRVRGADRYLRVSAARSKGGKAASGNLKRGQLKPEASREPSPADSRLTPGCVPAQAGEQPESSRSSAPALTASSEQRTTNREPTPRRADAAPLGERLCATFQRIRGAAYEPSFPDQDALRRLLQLAKGDEAEVERRYALGLQRTRFPLITTWVDLSKRWNDCAVPEATAPPRAADKRAPTAASDFSNAKTGTEDWT